MVPMGIVVTMGFVYGFAAVANFGILARERTQVLPFVFILLAIPAARGRHAAGHVQPPVGELTDA
jgi:hypothetical protein